MTEHEKRIREATEEGQFLTAMVSKDDLRALLADLDAMRVKAARYDWLRKHGYVEVTCKSPRDPSWTPQQLDDAIDLALKGAEA